MKKANILYFEPSTGYGGSSRCLLGWLHHLNIDKFNPFVGVYFDGPAIKDIKRLGIKVIKLHYINQLKKISLVRRGGELISYIIFMIEMLFNVLPVALVLVILIRIKKINLIHINANVVFGIPAIMASKFAKIPCICHIHETRKLNKKEKFFAKWVTKFIVLTKEAASLYARDFAKDKIAVVYNGLDLREFKLIGDINKLKKEFNLDDASAVVGMVGRIAVGKGHDDFIKAAERIIKIAPNVKFFIVGSSVLIDRDYEIELKKTVEGIGLSKNVIFTGWINDVKQIMSLFDILVFPSSTFPEGFPLTCIEGMALSKPVIASNISGPSEIVVDGVSGYLVPPANPNILATRITELINNPVLADKMGKAGRMRVEDLFDIRRTTKQIEDIYKSALNEGMLN